MSADITDIAAYRSKPAQKAGKKMSLTLVPTATADPVTPGDVAATAIAATRATTFLRAQSQWLQRGLAHGDDAVAVGIVLSAHDRSHDRWVNLIDIVTRTLGADAALQVATLYTYIGKVAGSLERDSLGLLSAEVAASARQLLAQRLTDLTEVAVEALWCGAAEV